MPAVDILYMLPNTPEPRNENIANLTKTQYKTGIMYWKKTPQNPKYSLSGADVFEIQVAANDHNPLKRLWPTIKYFVKARRKLKMLEPRCIHVSKFDSMFLAWRYKIHAKHKPSIIYDISDLHTLAYNDNTDLKSRFIKNIIWKIEKKISSSVDYIVVTSIKFFDEYYCDFYTKDQVIFVPNSPDINCFNKFERKSDGKYTIGFIGSVRYYNQIRRLIDVSKKYNINIFIAGSGEAVDDLKEYAKEYDNVVIYGEYNYKKQIKELYEKIDCVYALYDTKVKNVNISLPNRLYEGTCCGLPFIAAKGTYVAEVIKKYGIGVEVEDGNTTDLEWAIERVKSLPNQQVIDGCRKFYSENSFAKCSEKLSVVYNQLLLNR